MAQITIDYTDKFQSVLVRAQTEHGASVVTDLLTDWLLGRQKYQQEQDRTSFKAKFDALPEKDQQEILAKLATAILPMPVKGTP